nr:MAG: hypothetical protein [Guiyang tombus-like virus 3]
MWGKTDVLLTWEFNTGGNCALNTARGLSSPRLRPRGKLTKCLESLARLSRTDKLFRRRWTPDLPEDHTNPAAAFMAACHKGGVRILAIGSIPTDTDEEGPGELTYLKLMIEDGSVQLVFPDLVSYLVVYGSFRPRNSATLLSLKFRALEWIKKRSLNTLDIASGFASSVAFGFACSTFESGAISTIEHAMADLDVLAA